MERYRRLSFMEREELSRMLATGASLRATGRALGRAPSTVTRELARQHASREEKGVRNRFCYLLSCCRICPSFGRMSFPMARRAAC